MFFRSLRSFRCSRILLAKKDFYAVLGIPRSSTEDEIKKAYFSLAKKYHPDVNKDPDAKTKFSEINTAYETLGNAEKRQAYNSTGLTGDEHDNIKNSGFNPQGFGNPFSSSSDSTGFKNYQDMFTDFESFYTEKKSEKMQYKGEDISITVDIPFLDAIKGTSKKINFERKTICDKCEGNKSEPGSSPSKCGSCGGKGVIFYKKGAMSVQTACAKCKGKGFVIKSHCSYCKGVGYSYEDCSETVNIPAGVDSGQNLRVAKKGHQAEGNGPQGDLLLKVNVTQHPMLKREGQNVLSEVNVSIPQAALGDSIEIDTLYGKCKVIVDPGTNSGDQKKIPSFGIPFLPPNQHKKGDHVVTFKVSVPKKLSESQKQLYKDLAKEEDMLKPAGVFNKFKTTYN